MEEKNGSFNYFGSNDDEVGNIINADNINIIDSMINTVLDGLDNPLSSYLLFKDPLISEVKQLINSLTPEYHNKSYYINSMLTIYKPDIFPSESDQKALFSLNIGSPLAYDVSVDYFTRDDTAIAGADYVATSGTATIKAGETSVLIKVELIGDDKSEKDENFNLVITNPQGASFPPGVTEIMASRLIVDDD